MFLRLIRAILLILLTPLCLHSEVFLRVPRNAGRTLNGLGGSRVYESQVEINGRPGLLSTFAFNETSDITAARLARTLKLPHPGRSSVIILDASGKALTRYFIFQSPDFKDRSVVTALEQDSSILRKTPKGPPPWPDTIPVLNATASFTAVSRNTNSTFLSAVSNSATPEAAVSEAVNVLTGAGWIQTTPSTPNFRIMVKEHKQCVVFATEGAKSKDITINILQREGSRQ